MKKLITTALAAALLVPTTSFASQTIKRNTTYICTIEQMNRDIAICGLVPIENPEDDLCVRLEDDEELKISRVIYREEDEDYRACPVPAAFIVASGVGATNVVPLIVGLGGLGGAGAAAAAVAAAGILGAAAGSGSSNGTN